MQDLIFEKTEKGLEEIKSRTYRLESRLRTFLILVDGKQTVAELMLKVRGLGMDESHVADLMGNDFIQLAANQRSTPATKPNTLPQPPISSIAQGSLPTAPPALRTAHDIDLHQKLYKFYTETIKSNLGLRGYFMEVKVEKATSLQDLVELRLPFYEAIKKAKGEATARALLAHLDTMLQA